MKKVWKKRAGHVERMDEDYLGLACVHHEKEGKEEDRI